MKWIIGIVFIISALLLLSSVYLNAKAYRILARCQDLNRRSQVLEQEIGKLDRRIKKQEGFKHGFGA